MRMRVALTCIWTLCLALRLGPTAVADQSSRNSSRMTGAASSLYYRALTAVARAPRFRLVERTYLVRLWYTNDYRYVDPQRAYAAEDNGPKFGFAVQAQVGNVYCYWGTSPRAHRVVCSHVAWDQTSLSQSARLVNPYLPDSPELRLETETPRAAIVSIRGIVHPSLCPPIAQGCSAIGPRQRYIGSLLIDRRSGLPLRLIVSTTFVGGRALKGHLGLRLIDTYSYGRAVTIDLPRGRHVACPPWAPHADWCVARA